MLDGAGIRAYTHQVADVDRVIEQQKNAADHVAHECLGAKTDGESGDARRGDQRADFDADLTEDQDEGERPDRIARNARQQVLDGRHALAARRGERQVVEPSGIPACCAVDESDDERGQH